MRPFDVLALDAPLLGPKILEASAGTGKTFAIEHLVLRHLLEGEMEIEEILAITYTRAAAREMRLRIRENLKKALSALTAKMCPWPYLERHLHSKDAIRRIEGALASFERAQIFTIHGFCQRMLSEFSLEARCVQPEGGEAAPLGKAVRSDLLDFLETQQALGPEQMRELLKKKREFSRLCKDLLNTPLAHEPGTFARDCQAIAEALFASPFLHGNAEEAFEEIEGSCKYTDFKRAALAEQVEALQDLLRDPSSQKAVRRLLYGKGSLFDFVSPSNRKKGKEGIALPPLFEWAVSQLSPLIGAALDSKRLFQRLRTEWQEPFEQLLEDKGLFSPDFLLARMERSLAYPEFASQVERRYKAVIIDEFQDTDRGQWEIFSKLFQSLPCLTLVGDPKQSIYRFRNADLYTYYRARRSLVPYSLDTNYRSSPQLVSALNELFGERSVEPWLWLPSEKRTEPYHPIKAGLAEAWDPGDGMKPLQFFKVENLKEEASSFIAEEIERLRPHLGGYASFAILVQSNQQAALVQDVLQGRSLPCALKSRAPLGASLAMQTLSELFDALFFPRDPSVVQLFFAGPLMGKPFDLSILFSWKSALDKGGMALFFREFLASRWEGKETFYEKIAACGASFYRDFFQIVETLLLKEPRSYESIVRLFCEIEEADPEEDASARRRMDAGGDAIQILTMHTSKGLEFDVVFALGAAAPTPPSSTEDREEAEAEKLRQLYVALTRARKRLYVPLVALKSKAGGEPPLELFWQRSKLGKEGQEIVSKLAEINPHVGLCRELPSPSPRVAEGKQALIKPIELYLFPKPPGAIYSYSALAPKEGAKALPPLGEGEFPRGAAVGTFFHRVFERIFTEEREVEAIVRDEIRFANLTGWEEVVLQMVHTALSTPLFEGVSLLDLDRSQVRAEVEFFFHAPPHFFTGCIDLLFAWKNRLYFLDWKTNWLENGSEEELRRAMDEHNYWMQASLYAEAIRRAQPGCEIGGAIYLFLRGGALFFNPQPFKLSS